MRITGEQRPAFFGWVASIVGGVYEPSPYCKVITQLRDDGAIAAAVVYEITARDAHMTVASDGSRRWMTREFIREVFLYPFVQLGLARVTVLVPENNAVALDMDRRLGFVPEGRLRKFFGQHDGIVLGMLRSECRHIGDIHG